MPSINFSNIKRKIIGNAGLPYCLASELLGCWAAGLLGCWAAGLLGKKQPLRNAAPFQEMFVRDFVIRFFVSVPDVGFFRIRVTTFAAQSVGQLRHNYATVTPQLRLESAKVLIEKRMSLSRP